MTVKFLKFVPVEALVNLGCKPIDYLLATLIVSFYKQGKPFYDSYQGLANAIGVGSKTTAQSSVKRLVDMELVTVRSGFKKRNANEYSPTKKLIEVFNIDRPKNGTSYTKNQSIDIPKIGNHTPKGYVIPFNKKDSVRESSGEMYCSETYNRYLKDGWDEPIAKKYAIKKLNTKPKTKIN